MNREFFLNKVKTSKVLVYETDLKEADELEQHGFCTSAFLRRWQVIEAVSRELMILYRACVEVDTLGEKIFNKLLKQSININANNLKSQINNLIYSDAKKRSETSAKYIDIGVIESFLNSLDLKYDTLMVRYLIASKLNKSDTLPAGVDLRKTIREQRNDIIHKNGKLSQDAFEKIKPCIHHFFGLIDQIKEQVA